MLAWRRTGSHLALSRRLKYMATERRGCGVVYLFYRPTEFNSSYESTTSRSSKGTRVEDSNW